MRLLGRAGHRCVGKLCARARLDDAWRRAAAAHAAPHLQGVARALRRSRRHGHWSHWSHWSHGGGRWRSHRGGRCRSHRGGRCRSRWRSRCRSRWRSRWLGRRRSRRRSRRCRGGDFLTSERVSACDVFTRSTLHPDAHACAKPTQKPTQTPPPPVIVQARVHSQHISQPTIRHMPPTRCPQDLSLNQDS